MSKEIETNVRNILCAANVTVKAIYVGERQNALGGTNTMDAWIIAFTNTATKRASDFEYFTGIGLRAKPVITNKYTRNTLAWHAVEDARKPSTPEPASVLHSLLLDSDACNQSFAHWCMDYGYDEDSRKAYATYEACQKNADNLARVIPHTVRDALRDALQDY